MGPEESNEEPQESDQGPEEPDKKPKPKPKPRHAKIHLHSKPKDHLVSDAQWPRGKLKGGSPGEAKLMRELTIRLMEATKGMTLEQMEKKYGISKSTLSKIRRGEIWPTVATVARLEKMLSKRLWGDEHFQSPPKP